MNKQKVKEFIRRSIYDGAEYAGEWNGYEVWRPVFADNEVHYIGFPQYILIKGDSVRWSQGTEESFDIMHALPIEGDEEE